MQLFYANVIKVQRSRKAAGSRAISPPYSSSYVLTCVHIGIYWNNNYYLFQTTCHLSAKRSQSVRQRRLCQPH